MVDIKLNRDGDIDVSAVGDISLTESVRQAVLIRLRWIYDGGSGRSWASPGSRRCS